MNSKLLLALCFVGILAVTLAQDDKTKPATSVETNFNAEPVLQDSPLEDDPVPEGPTRVKRYYGYGYPSYYGGYGYGYRPWGYRPWGFRRYGYWGK